MSAVAVNRKIAKGFAKVGKKLGYAFNLYRADSFINPLADRNLSMTIPLTWSKDEGFKANPEPTLDYFILYCDYTVLRVGDILNQPTEDRTFLVYEINPLRGAMGVQCGRRMTVLRPVHTPTADKKTSFEEVMVNMPCAVESVTAAANDGALSTVRSSMSAGQSQIEVWTVISPGGIRLNDVLEVDGARYLIVGADNISAGTKIRAISIKAGR